MRVAILSDTHDHLEPLISALDLLRGRRAEYYIHCGDVGGQRILDALAGLPCTFVWGNNDYDVASLEDYAARLGLSCGNRGVELSLGGKAFFVHHGDDPTRKRAAIEGQQFDYILQGHTHIYNDQRSGRTRLINPGALHRAHPKSVALLNTETDHLERIVVSP